MLALNPKEIPFKMFSNTSKRDEFERMLATDKFTIDGGYIVVGDTAITLESHAMDISDKKSMLVKLGFKGQGLDLNGEHSELSKAMRTTRTIPRASHIAAMIGGLERVIIEQDGTEYTVASAQNEVLKAALPHVCSRFVRNIHDYNRCFFDSFGRTADCGDIEYDLLVPPSAMYPIKQAPKLTASQQALDFGRYDEVPAGAWIAGVHRSSGFS